MIKKVALTGIALTVFCNVHASDLLYVQKISGLTSTTASQEDTQPDEVLLGSCLEILEQGVSKGSGVYRILRASSSEPIEVYCDMVSEGGGWTLMTAQFESNPVEWDSGLQLESYDPTLSSSKSFAINLPPAHSQIAFGKDLSATAVDYFNTTYHVGNYAKQTMKGQKSGELFQVYRNKNSAIANNEPETGAIYGNNPSWNNVMILDKTGGTFHSWVFAPRHATPNNRGVGLNGGPMWSSQDYAWTLWVR